MKLRRGIQKPVPAGRIGDRGAYFVSQLRRDQLVGVDEEHPIALGEVQRGVALAGEVVQPSRGDPGAERGGARRRVVGGGAVEQHQPLVGPGQRLQAALDPGGLVAGQDRRGQHAARSGVAGPRAAWSRHSVGELDPGAADLVVEQRAIR